MGNLPLLTRRRRVWHLPKLAWPKIRQDASLMFGDKLRRVWRRLLAPSLLIVGVCVRLPIAGCSRLTVDISSEVVQSPCQTSVGEQIVTETYKSSRRRGDSPTSYPPTPDLISNKHSMSDHGSDTSGSSAATNTSAQSTTSSSPFMGRLPAPAQPRSFLSMSSDSSNSGSTGTPSTPATPATPSTPAIPATPATPATPTTPTNRASWPAQNPKKKDWRNSQ